MRTVEAPFVLVLAVAVSVAGCAGNPAPREWHPKAAAAQQSSRGGWIRIEAVDASGKKSLGRPVVEGELIAIDETAFHVLSRTGLQSVPRALGHKITLVGYGNRAGALVGWSLPVGSPH